jgi:putative transposase
VIVRGVDRREIFRDDLDRLTYCDQLARVLPEEGTTCFAWALMPNHVHLALRTGDRPLARAMHRVGFRYARHFNDRYERVGYLFQGRYKAIPIETDGSLANVIRYVHRNPLRAGIVDSLDALARHRWAGHGALVGRARAMPFHAATHALLLFSDDAQIARAAVRALMEEADGDADSRIDLACERDASGGGPAVARVDSPPERSCAAPPRSVGCADSPRAWTDRAAALGDVIRRVSHALRVDETDVRCGRRRRRDVSLARAAIAYVALHAHGIAVADTAHELGVARQSLYARLEQGGRAARRMALLES